MQDLKLRAFNYATKKWRWLDVNNTLTLTASEIAARWSDTVGGAYMEWSSIGPNVHILSFAVRENSLEPSVVSDTRLYAYLSKSDSDEVDSNPESLAVIMNTPEAGLYRSPDQLPDPVSSESGSRAFRLLEGSSAYALLQGDDGPPASGSITLELHVL